EQAPINDSGQVIGDTVLTYSFSTDQGNTWAAPIQIQTSGSPVGTLHNNVFAWAVAGDDGRVDIAWYGTPGVAPNPSNGPDSCTGCDWSLWMVQTLNGHAATPTFTAPILASEHFIHRGSMYTLIGGQNGDRKYEVNGLSSASMPQLDITNSSIRLLITAPCSAGAPCYQVVMQLKNLSLAPTITQDPDLDLVWLTQWFVPSTTDPNGGKN